MTSGEQFWLTWGVELANAIGTIGATVVALYLASRSYTPRLMFELQSEWDDQQEVHRCHLRVSNSERRAIAEDVQMHLVSFEETDISGEIQSCWNGDLPFRWSGGGSSEDYQVIGSPKRCDLCIVWKSEAMTIHPLRQLTSFEWTKKGQLACLLSVQARSVTADSEVIRIEIEWDGKWAQGNTEMQKHLVIRML